MSYDNLTDQELINNAKLIRGFKKLGGYAVTPSGEVFSLSTNRWISPYHPTNPSNNTKRSKRSYYYINGTSYPTARLVAYAYLGSPTDDHKQLTYYDVHFKNGDVSDVHPDNLFWEYGRDQKYLDKTKFDPETVFSIRKRYVELINNGCKQCDALDVLRKEYSTKKYHDSRQFFRNLLEGKRPYTHSKNHIPHDSYSFGTPVRIKNEKLKTHNKTGTIVGYDILHDCFSIRLDNNQNITTRSRNVCMGDNFKNIENENVEDEIEEFPDYGVFNPVASFSDEKEFSGLKHVKEMFKKLFN